MNLLNRLLTGCLSIQGRFYDAAIQCGCSLIGLKADRVTAGDIEFALLRGGKAEGQTILMVHGFGAGKDNWLQLAADLRKDYQIIAIDLVGHGESSLEADIHGQPLDFLIPSQMERLKTLLDALNLDKVHLMGSSMGGAISLLFAAAYPERLHSLTLLNNAGIDTPEPSEFFQLLDKGENPLIVRKTGDFIRLVDLVMSRKPWTLWLVASILERRALERTHLNDRIFADMLKSREIIGAPEQMEAILASIFMPVLVIWGSEDRVLHTSSVEVMQQHIPNMQAVILPGIGHVPMMEAPNSVGNAFRKFVKTL